MSRQQRRQELRRGGKGKRFPWELVIAGGIVLFFIAALAFSYLFPGINARSYATGSQRVQRLIISRAIDDLKSRSGFEFVYYGTYEVEEDEHGDEPHMHWAQYLVKDSGTSLEIREEIDSDKIDPDDMLVPYIPIRTTIDELAAALRDRAYSVRHPQPSDVSLQALIIEKKSEGVHEGFILYFTGEHKLNDIHRFKLVGPEEYMEVYYMGLISGIPEAAIQE